MDFTRSDVGHLLRRAGFGAPTPAVESLFAEPSWDAVVDRVLDTSASPADTVPAEVDDRVDQWYPPWVAGVQYWMDRMATSPTPIVEKMALFWHGLFTSSVDKMYPRLVFKQIKTYRRLALGDLHELAQAMALDPAMLLYLDNESNVAGRPNENFARELMELFLLGRANYAEADVAPMARAWTGHGYNSTTETYTWNATKHDGGAKTIFGITRNWDGPETITEMVRGSKQAVCARFIAGKVWAFLAGPAPAPATLDAAGRRLRRLEHGHQGARAGGVRAPGLPGPGHPHRPRAQPGRVDGRGDAGARPERGDAPPRVVGRTVRPAAVRAAQRRRVEAERRLGRHLDHLGPGLVRLPRPVEGERGRHLRRLRVALPRHRRHARRSPGSASTTRRR